MTAPAPLTPEWWVDRLSKRLFAERAAMEEFDRYDRGDFPLPFVREDLREPFLRLLKISKINLMELVIDAAEERLNVIGFNFGDPATDKAAWQLWQKNGMEAESIVNHRESLVKSRAAVIVWPGPDGPTITVEDPLSTIVEYVPGNRRQRAAALKLWRDDWTGNQHATLYLPEGIFKFETRGVTVQSHIPGQPPTSSVMGGWAKREVRGEPWPLPNPFDVVPVVPFPNKPDIYGHGRSEIASVMPSQDRINKIIFDRMMAAEFTSFKQRWATGMDIPTDPVTGEDVEPFNMAVERLLINENPEGRFGEFGQTDLQPYLEAAEQDLRFIAAVTRTPPHYLNTNADRLSGESIKSAETGLVAKVRRKQRHYGESWQEVIRLAFAADGNRQAASFDEAKTAWDDPESRTESEHADAVGKLRTLLHLPRTAAWEIYGFSPTEIARFKELLAAEALTEQGVDVTSLFGDDDPDEPAVPADGE
jgi:hypothetical protein